MYYYTNHVTFGYTILRPFCLRGFMQITLDIPDTLYRELLNQAENSNRSVEEVVLQKIEGDPSPRFSAHPQQAKMRQEVDYFDRHLEALWQEFPNLFVAVHHQEVIDSDEHELNLVRRIRNAYPNEAILIRKATGKPVPELHFRSPRFNRE